MLRQFTFFKNYYRIVSTFFCVFLMIVLFSSNTFARQTTVYATKKFSDSHVDNPDGATDTDLNTAAKIKSSAGIAVGIGAYTGKLEFGFKDPVPAHTTTFIKIKISDDIFKTLLGGNLGSALGGIVGTVVLGNHFINVQVKNSASNAVLLNGSSSVPDQLNKPNMRLIVGPDGYQYLAVTPTSDYDQIVISDHFPALVGLLSSGSSEVYGAFYVSGTPTCLNFAGASLDVSGALIDVVTDPVVGIHKAIDGNVSTAYSINSGLIKVGVGAKYYQNFFLSTPSRADQEVKLTLSTSGSLLNLDLFNGLEVVLYNGTSEVSRKTLSQLNTELLGIIELDLLGLFNSGQQVTYSIKPNTSITHVTLEIGSALSLGLGNTLSFNIHEISMTAGVPTVAGLDANRSMFICSGESPILTATPMYLGDVIKWYEAPVGGSPVHTGATFEPGPINVKTKYYVSATSAGCSEESVRSEVIVDLNPDVILNINGSSYFTINPGQSITLPSVAVSNGTGTGWVAQSGPAVGAGNNVGPFNSPGTYVYRYSATGTGPSPCTNYVEVTVSVTDPAGCNVVNNRRYANNATETTFAKLAGIPIGSVTDVNFAADGDLSKGSLLSESIGLLGGVLTGKTTQTLRWNHTIAPGVPVTVRLGREFGLAAISGSIGVQAMDGNTPIGPVHAVDGELVSVVNGINVFEYTFVPSEGTPKSYNGVKVILNSNVILGAVQNVRVFGAYYHEVSGNLDDCAGSKPDIMVGFESIISGLNVASGLTAVSNEMFAIDGDMSTAATLNNAVGVNIKSKLDITLPYPALVGDSVMIKIGVPSSLLDLELIKNFTIQRYAGSAAVGAPIALNDALLTLHLLADPQTGYIVFKNDLTFDRVKFLSGGIVSALSSLDIYEFKVVPMVQVPNLKYDGTNKVNFIELCAGGSITFPTDGCDQFKFYSAASGGTEITEATIKTWAAGTVHKVYVQAVRFNCEIGDHRQEIEIRIIDVKTPILNPTGTQFVKAGDPVVISVTNTADYSAGVKFEWYKDGNLISGVTGPTLSIPSIDLATNLGAYTAVAVLACKSAHSVATTLSVFDVVGWKSYVTSTGEQFVSGNEEVTYTIHVRNKGTLPVSGLVITDAIPANTTYIAGSATSGGTGTASLVTWNNVQVAAGATVAVSFKVKVKANLVGVTGIQNVALIKRNTSDPGSSTYPPKDNTNPIEPNTTAGPGTTIPVVLKSNLAVDKIADQARVKAGTETTFTIKLKNTGPSVLASGSEIVLLERPGSGVSILGYSIKTGPAIINVNGLRAVVTTNAQVEVGGEIVVQVRAMVDPGATGTITNGISVWTTGVPETEPPVVDDTDPIPVDRETDLAIIKTIDNNSPFVGDPVKFTLQITNNGPSTATGVVVTDNLPNGFEYVSSTASVGSYNASTGKWAVGNMTNGGTATLEITAKVLATGDYHNIGSVTGTETDPDLTNNTDSPDDPVVPINKSDSRLEIVKNNALANGVDENRLEVTLLAGNGDGVPNIPVTFTITRPGNVVSTQVINTNASGKALLAITSTTVGQVQVAAVATGYTITGSPRTVTFVAGAVDHAKSKLEVTKNNALANGIDKNILVATIVDAANHPLPNQNVVFTITNIDNSTTTQTIKTNATGLATLELTSYQIGQMTVAATVGGTAISGSPKTVTFVTGGPDPNLSTLVVTKNNAVADGVDQNILVATIVDAFGHKLQNVDVVFSILDIDLASTSQTIKTNVNGTATLALTSTKIGNMVVSASLQGNAISGSPKTVTFKAGGVDYTKSTLIVTKNNAAADGVDENRLLATIVDSQGNALANTQVDFEVTDVDLVKTTTPIMTDAAGQAILRVKSIKPGQVVVAATVAGTAINGSPKTVTFVNASNLAVYKVADQSRVIAGTETTFTITVRNNGPVALAANSKLLLKERPGVGVEIVRYEMISGAATLTQSGLDATLTTTSIFGVGSEIKVRVVANVLLTATNTITNGISVWGPNTPPTDNPDDTDDTDPIPVDQVTDLAIVKTVDNFKPFVGSQVIFTLEVTNNGPSNAKGVKVIDQLPSGYSYVSFTSTVGTYDPSSYVWTIGNMKAGEKQSMTITAKVLASGDYINIGTVTGSDKDPDLSNNTDSPDEPVIPVPIKGLKGAKVANVTKVEPGQAIEFTITLTNQGPNTLASGSEILLKELPSAGLSITAITVASGPATISVTGNNATLKTNAVLGVDQNIVVKVMAKVSEDAKGTISNRVQVWGPDTPPTDDPDVDTTTPPIPVDTSSKLSLTKVSDSPTVFAGGKANFTVTITNNGPGTLKAGSKVLVSELPSAGLANLTYQISTNNATIANDNNNLTLTLNKDVAKAGTIVLKVTADVTAKVGSTISNRVKVWGPDTPPTKDPDDEKETPEIPVINNYSLSITKVADQSKVLPGTTTTFTVTVQNDGPQAVPSGRTLTILEVPGAGITIQNYAIVSGAATIQGTGNNATLTTTADLANGGKIVIKITGKVDENAQGNISNGIKVWNDTKIPEVDVPDDEDNMPPVPVDNELLIPNMFTPNGDGLNDRFVIKGLNQYSQREISIVNRWGSQVYQSKNYNSDWDGGNLPEGTYFYVLKIKGQGDWIVKQGAIAIVRNTNR